MSDVVRFYFSFRSPYSWLGFYRFQKIIDKLPVTVEYIPCFPRSNSKVENPGDNKLKRIYMSRDIKRFTDAYGLLLNWPETIDTDWLAPHVIFLYALDNQLGVEYAMNVYSARFEQGLNVGDVTVLKNIGQEIGMKPDDMMTVVNNNEYLERFEDLQSNAKKDNLFGVPFFVYSKNKYWGNDRLDWLVRDIFYENNMEIPDLTADPFLSPF